MRKVPLKTVVLYSNGHIGSMLVLNKILKMKCYKVTAVVRVSNIEFNNKGLKKVRRKLHKTGFLFAFMLFYQYLVQALALLISFMLPFLKKRMITSSELAAKHKFEIHDAENINSPETIDFLRKHQPEVMISAYFPQILKREALAVPSKGILNVHPGFIPAYKGAMAYFWAVKNNARCAGVSIHWMDEGIDTGPLLARKSFKIFKNTSQDQVLIKTALIGSSLLRNLGTKLSRGETLEEIDTSSDVKGYYSMPGKKAFREYFLTHSFFSFGAIFRAILGKY